MAYTESDQRADTAFLVGAAYGRRAQAERIVQEFWRRADPSSTGIWRDACDLLVQVAEESQ